jgi:hypothetical protein
LIIGTKIYFTVPFNKNGKHGIPDTMLVEMNANMKANQEKADANIKAMQEKANANLKELKEDTKTNQSQDKCKAKGDE